MTDIVDPKLEYHKTVCVLCSNNCGVEVRLDDREITRVRGNKAHLASKGYTCEKALRINHYQNNTGRLSSPMKRMPDGSYLAVDWDTAIAEIVAEMKALGDEHGQDKIMYYGGGAQGNHLGGAYGAALRSAFGIKYRSNALAQEKTGEAWVDGHMFGAHLHGDFHHAEVSVFVGKNPWHSHGFDETRRVLKDIKADDSRSMIVIDPRVSETAAMADFHLQVQPGTDAFCIAALGGVLVQEDLLAKSWLEENTVGSDAVVAELAKVDVADFARRCDVSEDLIRSAARRMAAAESVAVLEDLGVEMAPNSTLVSYLQKLLWVLVGSYARPGAMTGHSSLVPIYNYSATGREPSAPVTGGMIISGLVACNDIPAEVMTDHPNRTRGMVIETANPVHSLASSEDFRQMMRALDFSLVIDVAMTETAKEASWVLPASSQYEKVECTFFGASFPENVFTLRPPILEPMEGTLPEPEIHTRLIREAGLLPEEKLAPLRAAAEEGLDAFSAAFASMAAVDPEFAALAPVVMYETLGTTLPEGMEGAAVLWFTAQRCAMKNTDAMRAAGFTGEATEIGNQFFTAMIERGVDGVTYTKHEYDDAWTMLKTDEQKINMDLPELIADLAALSDKPTTHATDDFPFILSAGERRAFTANANMRDPEWRKKDKEGALRMSPADAAQVGVEDGSRVRITTPGGSSVAVVEINDTYRDGHVALPNGHGLEYAPGGGDPEVYGVSTNELTTTDWKDEYAGTPWHKHVPARLEPVS